VSVKVGDVVKDPALLRPGMRIKRPDGWGGPPEMIISDRHPDYNGWRWIGSQSMYLGDAGVRREGLLILALPGDAPALRPGPVRPGIQAQGPRPDEAWAEHLRQEERIRASMAGQGIAAAASRAADRAEADRWRRERGPVEPMRTGLGSGSVSLWRLR
jgi:hypothetical protein